MVDSEVPEYQLSIPEVIKAFVPRLDARLLEVDR
jgi:hypothetical protein